jgi:hypothetical protein
MQRRKIWFLVDLGRTILLWIFGLFASAMVGGMISEYFYGRDGDALGGAIGATTFVFARFWATERKKLT